MREVVYFPLLFLKWYTFPRNKLSRTWTRNPALFTSEDSKLEGIYGFLNIILATLRIAQAVAELKNSYNLACLI